MARALETASFISDKLGGIPVYKFSELKEIKFGKIPHSTYLKGAQAIRLYLFEETKKAKVVINKEIFKGSAMVVSHSFLMRRIFVELFGGDIAKFITDSRFINYLSGFDCKMGAPFSLLKPIIPDKQQKGHNMRGFQAKQAWHVRDHHRTNKSLY